MRADRVLGHCWKVNFGQFGLLRLPRSGSAASHLWHPGPKADRWLTATTRVYPVNSHTPSTQKCIQNIWSPLLTQTYFPFCLILVYVLKCTTTLFYSVFNVGCAMPKGSRVCEGYCQGEICVFWFIPFTRTSNKRLLSSLDLSISSRAPKQLTEFPEPELLKFEIDSRHSRNNILLTIRLSPSPGGEKSLYYIHQCIYT